MTIPMDRSKNRNILSLIPLFHGLTMAHLTELDNIIEDRVFERAQTIFSEGDNANGFYVVITGRVKIFKVSPDGKEQIIHIYGPNNIFGEVPMFAGGNFPANAIALERTKCFFFPRDAFMGLIKTDPSLAMNMLAELSKKLRQLTHLIEEISLKEVPGRLATYLLLLSEGGKRKEITLDVTKTQLSALLGTIPETLSRILSKMVHQRLIALKSKKIVILNPTELKELAEGLKKLD
ncbi:MAG: Crp/Fnr family transcriptional regulator [Thermodesulfovibrionales bacterium]|nr:Crp/Fnr family transcriptional regulator [Thermodesulfovibrionales bacterium]